MINFQHLNNPCIIQDIIKGVLSGDITPPHLHGYARTLYDTHSIKELANILICGQVDSIACTKHLLTSHMFYTRVYKALVRLIIDNYKIKHCS